MNPRSRLAHSLLFGAILIAGACLADSASDPLVAELEHWKAALRDTTLKDDLWVQSRPGAQPAVDEAEQALRAGDRLFALQRLGTARVVLGSAMYALQRPPELRDSLPALEAEWQRFSHDLRRTPSVSERLSDVRPAALRALAEAALSQAPVYYDASLDYGRNTAPLYGYTYLGVSQALQDYVDLCRKLATPIKETVPRIRAIPGEIDALEAEMLAAYRPPASIDRHRDFILTSSLLKEARELDAAGSRYGALLRYLQSAQRLAPLQGDTTGPAAAEIEARLAAQERRLGRDGADHSIARLFFETARFDLSTPGTRRATAWAVTYDVLPRYLAALGPAPARSVKVEPSVTVTLVRWPYT